MGVGYVTGFKRVAADKFCQLTGLVGFGHFPRPHLIKKDLYASFCSLPGCFRPGESAADYHEFRFHYSLYPHSFFMQIMLLLPRAYFSAINGAPHCGHGFGTGLSHIANVQVGYFVHE